MKRTPLILSIIALVVALCAAVMAIVRPDFKKKPASEPADITDTGKITAVAGDIVYVQLDSLIANYDMYNDKMTAFQSKVQGIQDELQKRGVEVIYDDRNVRPGVMFSDGDLLGIPVRAVVSPRNMKENMVEISTRDKSVQKKVSTELAADEIQALVNELLSKCGN